MAKETNGDKTEDSSKADAIKAAMARVKEKKQAMTSKVNIEKESEK